MKKKLKNLSKIVVLSLISCLYSFNSYAETKNSNSSVKETEFTQTIQELADKYNIKISPSKASLSRQETAILLLQVLKKIPEDKLNFVEKTAIESLKQEYNQEFEQLKNAVEVLNDQTDINTTNIERIDNTVSILNDAITFKFFGSMAFRNCFMANDMLTQPQNILTNMKGNIFQTRIAAGITGKVVNDFNYQLRIFTGDVNSFNIAWMPFNANLTRIPFVFDRFFIGYQPTIFNNANHKTVFTVGKANNIFPESELFFDEDVSFNGFTQKYTYSDKETWLKELSFGLSENILTVEGPYNNSFVIGGKGALEIQPHEKFKIRGAASYVALPGAEKTAVYQFLQGYTGETGKRNRTTAGNPNLFANKFNLFDSYLKFTYLINEKLPLDIFADFVYNFGSPDKNKGYLFGLNLGNFEQTGDWFLSYNFKHLEQDYNLSYLAQEQMGGTDVSGHQVDLGYQIADKTKAFLTVQTRNNLTNPAIPTLYIIYTNIRQDF